MWGTTALWIRERTQGVVLCPIRSTPVVTISLLPCCDHKSAATLTGTRQALNILNAGVLGSSILCLSHFFNNLSFLVPVKAKDARMSLFHLGYHR